MKITLTLLNKIDKQFVLHIVTKNLKKKIQIAIKSSLLKKMIFMFSVY